MASHKKPFHTLRNGGMKAAIWLNDGIKGPFFSTTFSRSFKDRSGAWRNARSFSFSDLEALMNIIGPFFSEGIHSLALIGNIDRNASYLNLRPAGEAQEKYIFSV